VNRTFDRLARRHFLELAGMTLAMAGLPRLASAGSRKPNILFILADDLGIGDVGCYGQSRLRTPHIDGLAREGKRFTQAYAGAPICSPSRCSLLTGLNTGHSRIRANFALAGGTVGQSGGKTVRRASLGADDVTVAQQLQAQGYRTGLMGKWHLDGYDPNATPLDHGFDEFRGWLIQTPSTQGYFPTQRYRDRQLVDIPQASAHTAAHYETDLCTDDACDFIRRNTAQPFFLFVGYSAPHSPYISPSYGSFGGEPWSEDQKSYAAMIELMDQGVGSVLRTLAEQGLDRDTVVFFASDNGARSEPTAAQTAVVEFFDSSGIYRGYKRDLYEGGIHEPFIVRWPGTIKAGSLSDEPVYFPDFLPTALALAGAPMAKVDGVDLSSLLQHEGTRLQQRYFYWETFEPEFRQAVRWGNWKAIRLSKGVALELYELKTDPRETRNIAAQHPQIIARLEAYLAHARVPSVEYP
jgi:arylsulfatase A-like enzyme